MRSTRLETQRLFTEDLLHLSLLWPLVAGMELQCLLVAGIKIYGVGTRIAESKVNDIRGTPIL
jgi:hypothetical protein